MHDFNAVSAFTLLKNVHSHHKNKLQPGEQPMEIVGVDIGFGFTKAFNGKRSVIFKSLMGNSTDIQFQQSMGVEMADANLHISLDDTSYFLGDYAELQSNVRDFTLDQHRMLSEFAKIFALAAVGECCSDTSAVNLVTGLPVTFLKRDYKKFKEKLSGSHRITFHTPGEQSITKTININKIQIIPQPAGSVFNIILNKYGKISDRKKAMQKLGVVDIGFKTTDFTVFDHLQYVERSSATLDSGISRCFSIIADKLRHESNVNIELYRIFKYIDSGAIKIKGREYNIKSLIQNVYSHAASAIATELNRLWENDWDIDAIVLSGGGSMELAPFLTPHIEGNVIPISSNADTRLSNVHGYWKFGKYKWDKESNMEKTSPPEMAKPKMNPPHQPGETPAGGEEYEKKNSDAHELSHSHDKKDKNPKGLGWLKK